MRRYEKYINNDLKILGEIPAHWKVLRFKNITTKIQDGTHFTPNYTDNGINFLSVNDITRKNFDLNSSKFISIEEHRELIKRCRPVKGDILLSKNGTIGVPFLINFDTEISIYVSLCLIRLKKEVYNKYFLYLLQSSFMFEQYKINAKTNSVSNLHLDKLANFYSVIAPLIEQQAIANYLDAKTQAIDKKVTLLEQKIETYKKLKRTLINQTITKGLRSLSVVEMKDSGISWIGQIPQHWEVKRFKSFADTIKGKNLEVFDNQIEGTLPNLSLEYLRNDSVGFEAFVKTNNRNLIVDENDLIIVWDGAGVGEILNGKVGVISSTIAKLKFNKSVNAKFFSFIRYDLEYRLKQIPTGMGIPHLNPHELKNFMCPIPPKSEQEEIAKYLDQKTATIDAILSNISKQIDTLKQLRKTLINDVVTGKIKVVE